MAQQNPPLLPNEDRCQDAQRITETGPGGQLVS